MSKKNNLDDYKKLIEDDPKPEITKTDLARIEAIVNRAVDEYGDRIKADRLTAALVAAHIAKPIRLSDLLATCHLDFYSDVIGGAYRHYQPKTGTFKDEWTARHSEPELKSLRWPWDDDEEE